MDRNSWPNHCTEVAGAEDPLLGRHGRPIIQSQRKTTRGVLLMLARSAKERVPESVVPRISQEPLAEMVGTTLSRVSLFMGNVHLKASGHRTRED